MFNGIIQTILVVFSMKKSRAGTSMMSSENNDFKFLKTSKKHEKHVHQCTIVPGLMELFYLSKLVYR